MFIIVHLSSSYLLLIEGNNQKRPGKVGSKVYSITDDRHARLLLASYIGHVQVIRKLLLPSITITFYYDITMKYYSMGRKMNSTFLVISSFHKHPQNYSYSHRLILVN